MLFAVGKIPLISGPKCSLLFRWLLVTSVTWWRQWIWSARILRMCSIVVKVTWYTGMENQTSENLNLWRMSEMPFFRKVHRRLQRKAIEFFTYTWSHGGGQVDEEVNYKIRLRQWCLCVWRKLFGYTMRSLQRALKEIADFLPPRLYGQLAVHIHMETLRRVKLFEVFVLQC